MDLELIEDQEFESQKSQWPEVLKMKDVAEILRISLVKSYDVIHLPGFPYIKVGRVIRVPRDPFFRWLEHQALESNNPLPRR